MTMQEKLQIHEEIEKANEKRWKQIKVEWCENWIRAKFAKHPFPGGGFERGHFFKMAEKAGLFQPNVYGGPFSRALSNLCEANTKFDDNGNVSYYFFTLKK